MKIHSENIKQIINEAQKIDGSLLYAQVLLGAFLHQDEMNEEQLEILKKDTKLFLDDLNKSEFK